MRGDDRADARLIEEVGYERADVREDLALERFSLLGRGWMRRASVRRTRIVASSSGAREERRKRLQRLSSSPNGSRRSWLRSSSGAVTMTLRSWTRATRRVSTALRRASNSSRSASPCCPARGVARCLVRARSGRRGQRRADRPCRAAAVRHGCCARLRVPARRCAEASARGRHRSGRRPRQPTSVRLARVDPRIAAPPRSRARGPPSSPARSARQYARRRSQARARHDGYRRRPRSPVRLQAPNRSSDS